MTEGSKVFCPCPLNQQTVIHCLAVNIHLSQRSFWGSVHKDICHRLVWPSAAWHPLLMETTSCSTTQQIGFKLHLLVPGATHAGAAVSIQCWQLCGVCSGSSLWEPILVWGHFSLCSLFQWETERLGNGFWYKVNSFNRELACFMNMDTFYIGTTFNLDGNRYRL